jgi:hypothetical protein
VECFFFEVDFRDRLLLHTNVVGNSEGGRQLLVRKREREHNIKVDVK